MADAGNPGPGEFPTILGPDANFKGELSFEKGMRLMGRFEGKVNTPGRVHIAKEAKMAADVEAGGIVVEGEVQGNLSAADRIELKKSARYEGDLRASKLVVDEGAVFSGHVSVGPDSVKGRPRAERGSERPGQAPTSAASRRTCPARGRSRPAVEQWRRRRRRPPERLLPTPRSCAGVPGRADPARRSYHCEGGGLARRRPGVSPGSMPAA